MSRPSLKQHRLVILLLVLITFSIAYYAGQTQKRQERKLPHIEGVLINPPHPAPPIDLYSQEGVPFSITDLQGHWSLLMLDPAAPGTTASIALTRLIQVHNRLAAEPGLQQQIYYLYLSRDKFEDAAISFASLSDNFQALQGDTEMVNKVFKDFGIYADEMGDTLYLIGPDTKMHALFTQVGNPATIADDINNLITALQ